jgi:hypothetical protein
MSVHRFSTALALCALGAAVSSAWAYEPPPRKPGLWEMTMSSSARGEGAQAPMVTQQCIDAATDKAMREMGQGVNKDMCSKNEVTSSGGTMRLESVCKMGQTTATTRGTVTGDFTQNYRMDMQVNYNPPLMGKSEHSMSIQAKWLGPCKADQKPGDMILPGGMKMNVMNMPGRSPFGAK